MRRVLVALDGSTFSEAIIPDARRLAGTDGGLILVREATLPMRERDIFVDSTMLAVAEAEWYLQHEAERLREDGVKVRTESLVLADAASAIDEAVRIFKADIIAIATHGRGPFGRLLHGGVAWRALAHSPVPVLLRHVGNGPLARSDRAEKRRIMVPLDGSAYAEKALPLAQELALEWNASLWLVQVVFAPDYPVTVAPCSPVAVVPANSQTRIEEAQRYLAKVADSLSGEIHVQVGLGGVVDHLEAYVEQLSITDVIMSSHGRTGLPRVILGSVADELIHRLHEPIIVVPALAAGRLEEHPSVDLQEITASQPAQKASTP